MLGKVAHFYFVIEQLGDSMVLYVCYLVPKYMQAWRDNSLCVCLKMWSDPKRQPHVWAELSHGEL